MREQYSVSSSRCFFAIRKTCDFDKLSVAKISIKQLILGL